MKPYIGIVSKDPGSSYGIVFPDAPGCFSAADDADRLFEMAAEALEGWLETMIESGLPVPETRDLSEIKADPAWSEDFGNAVMVIAVPNPIRGGDARAA